MPVTWEKTICAPKGILIGAEKSQEWMLGWWYSHYRKYHDLPIAICDFGLSEQGLKKARQLGTVLDFNKDDLLKIFDLPLCPKKQATWQELYTGPLQNIHPIWMLKPFSLMKSPFEKTIWIDLDCEIRGPLDPIFSFINSPSGFTVAPDTAYYQSVLESRNELLPGEVIYNSGVIGFRHKSRVIDLWTRELLSNHANYLGDQDALSRIIHRHRLPIHRMPKQFNARLRDAHDPSMTIIHYVQLCGKMRILEQMLLQSKG
ncbi:MAG: hypothetical protein KDK44_04150 [Chlamydiia bacterium]|nr:hypothetical protein [Chlamydiia bacterium]MCP5509454.1 hypothetical protein [Chlamydiales bacterium]